MTDTIIDSARKAAERAGEKLDAAKTATETAIESTRTRAAETIASGRVKAADGYAAGKAKASEAYAASRATAQKAYGKAQKGVTKAKARTAKELDDNPLAFLIGGLALGALAGSLLPRTRQETKVLGPTGRKIQKTARDAATAAKAAGTKKLDSLGLKETAKKQATALLKSVGEAASEAGSAAAKTVKPKPKRRATASKP